MAKYEKINYYIIGRFTAGKKFGIVTRKAVDGYTVNGIPGIAVRKSGKFWYVDHTATGLAIVSVGSATRDAAISAYTETWRERVEKMSAEFIRNAVKTFQDAPTEKDVETWETVNYCTLSNWRFDRVSEAAQRRGLIVRKADDATYLNGGNINISGSPEALKPIREMIDKYNEKEQHAVPENRELTEEEIAMCTFTKDCVIAKGVTFPATYNMTRTGEVLCFVELAKDEIGRTRKQKIVIDKDNPLYTAALDARNTAIMDSLTLTAADHSETETATVDDHSETKTVTEAVTETAAPEPETETETTAEPEAETETETETEERRSNIPEKTFIGTEIKGNGWRILFDPETERTRIIFQEPPKKRALTIVKDARFFWSPSMKSWNKKLTFKAFRAAKEIAKKLDKIYGAAA